MRVSRLLLLLTLSLGAQDFSRDFPGLLVDVRTPPAAVRCDGRYLLQYELSLLNTATQAMTIQEVEVMGPGKLASLEGRALAQAVPFRYPYKTDLPAEKALVILLAVFAERVPRSLTHRIRFTVAGSAEPLVVDHSGTPVFRSALRLGPPLSGGCWLAANGAAGNNHHTAGMMPWGGRARVPQRFAIDFVQLNADGETHPQGASENRAYRCYGAEALAAATGRVVDVIDGIPENRPHPSGRAVKMTAETVSGNLVVIDLGGGRFAAYAHLQPASIRVWKGDRVRRGHVLGLVGNSGNSTEPHLHFQVGSDAVMLRGEGLPFAFDSFVREGRRVRSELPRDGWIVDFTP